MLPLAVELPLVERTVREAKQRLAVPEPVVPITVVHLGGVFGGFLGLISMLLSVCCDDPWVWRCAWHGYGGVHGSLRMPPRSERWRSHVHTQTHNHPRADTAFSAGCRSAAVAILLCCGSYSVRAVHTRVHELR